MVQFKDKKYENTRLQIDNCSFDGCEFKDCLLEYSASGKVSFSNCHFTGRINWVFSGAAKATVEMLKGIYHGMGEGGMKVVEGIINEIRSIEPLKVGQRR